MLVCPSELSRLKGSVYVDHAGAALYTDTQLRNIFQESCCSPTKKMPSVVVGAEEGRYARVRSSRQNADLTCYLCRT